MFRRRWSGLPADPDFGSNLAELGYFVNDVDEIRSLDDPDSYYKFFLTKNGRWNERQRFCFNEAIGKVIRSRLDDEGLKKVLLPLGTVDPTQPHVEIRVSDDMKTKSRVVVILGESTQELGVIAHRVLGGSGGINKGSMINLVREIKKQASSATDSAAPGIILANPGELFWWPEGQRSLTPTGRHAVPMASAVHYGRYHDPEKNDVPENRTSAEHVRYILEKVVPAVVPAEAKIDIISVGIVAEEVEAYLNDDAVWAKLGDRMNSLTVLESYYNATNIKCEGFKAFMEKRAQAYIMDGELVGALISSADGVLPEHSNSVVYGCPVFSAGEETLFIETILINAQAVLLKRIQELAPE